MRRATAGPLGRAAWRGPFLALVAGLTVGCGPLGIRVAPPSAPTGPAATGSAAAAPSADSAAGRPDAVAALDKLYRADKRRFGAPLGEAQVVAGGYRARYAAADLYYSPATGAVAVESGARQALASAGGVAKLGLPTSAAVCSAGGCFQDAERGRLYVPDSGAPRAVPAASTVELTSILNFRDVAGTGAGLPLTQGGHLARGVVYRSGVLSPASDWDRLALTSLGLSGIYDLRTDAVRARHPDVPLAGVPNRSINIFAVRSSPPAPWRTAAQARAYARADYVAFVTDPRRRRAEGSLLRALAKEKGPVIIHCTYGKDRTGWMSAMIQLTAGVPEADVIASFLESNRYREKAVDGAYRADLKKYGKTYADARRQANQVEAEYLRAGLDAIEARYGSQEAFLKQGLRLTTGEIKRLRERLVA